MMQLAPRFAARAAFGGRRAMAGQSGRVVPGQDTPVSGEALPQHVKQAYDGVAEDPRPGGVSSKKDGDADHQKRAAGAGEDEYNGGAETISDVGAGENGGKGGQEAPPGPAQGGQGSANRGYSAGE
jgi:hypothetical protein